MRFEATNDHADLARAAESLRIAVRASEPGQPDTAIQQIRLGQLLLELPEPVPAETFAEAIGNLQAAAGNTAARSDLRVDAARTWGQGAAQAQQWDLALAGYAAACELLPLAAWPGLRRADRESQLASWPGLACDAGACALQAGRPELAVELIEQGRSVLWGQMLRSRTDLGRLGQSHPEFYSKIIEIRDILDKPEAAADAESGVMGSPRRDTERRIRAAREWDALLAAIRALPGFDEFGRPVPFDRLAEAAVDGPVVIINVSRLRCDALMLTSAGLTVLPLDGLSWDAALARGDAYLQAVQRLSGYGEEDHGRAETQDRLRDIDSTLAWLWDVVTEPVLTRLGYSSPPGADQPWPRLWWSATGPLSLLPIHAAGRPDLMTGAGPASVLDLVVSSYTPTLQALIRARKTLRADPADRRLLIVAVPTAPADSDLPDLPGAAREAGWLAARFPGAHSLREGSGAVVADVVRLIPQHAIAHFAAHGEQDLVHPSDGGLQLSDGVLTVPQVAALDLSQAELASLSACQTAIGGVRLLDESARSARAAG